MTAHERDRIEIDGVTVVGGGIGGLVAAITAADAGIPVQLFEAGRELGGRARSAKPPYVVNWGPHALYSDGPLWQWLAERSLIPECVEAAVEAGVVFRWHGRAADPSEAYAALAVLHSAAAPAAARSFNEWATEAIGPDLAHALASMAGVFTFHHDPGSLSALFVLERLARVTALPPAARFVVGGWSRLVKRLADEAERLDVKIHLRRRVATLPPGPAILAIPVDRARRLLRKPALRYRGATTALLDVALIAESGDPYAVWDMDECGFAETYTHRDPGLAPEGENLVQAQIGLRPGETFDHGICRLEALLDLGYPRWRERLRWRRQARIRNQTGAVDLPGLTWRDRIPIDQGGGRYLVGDMVAAPGLLSEVSHASALDAVARIATPSNPERQGLSTVLPAQTP